jgi:hypothetical protein
MKHIIYEHCKATGRFSATIGNRTYMYISPASAERVKQYILNHGVNVQYINLTGNYFGMRATQ